MEVDTSPQHPFLTQAVAEPASTLSTVLPTVARRMLASSMPGPAAQGSLCSQQPVPEALSPFVGHAPIMDLQGLSLQQQHQQRQQQPAPSQRHQGVAAGMTAGAGSSAADMGAAAASRPWSAFSGSPGHSISTTSSTCPSSPPSRVALPGRPSDGADSPPSEQPSTCDMMTDADAPMSPSAHQDPPSTRHAGLQDSSPGDREPGMQSALASQQLGLPQAGGQPGFALPSLHAMLGDAAARLQASAPFKLVAAALPAPPAPAPAAATSKAVPAAATASGPAAAAAGPGPSSSIGGGDLHMLSTAAGAAAPASTPSSAAAARGPGPEGPGVDTGAPHSAACSFLQACAERGAAAALAVLVFVDKLPVEPGDAVEGADAPLALPRAAGLAEQQQGNQQQQQPQHDALLLTLAYMYVLAARANLLRDLDDTAIRALLWMCESFFSQYRCSCRQAAYDYIFFATGCDMADPLVIDTLKEEVPAMVQLQLRVLTAAGFRMWVQPAELRGAAATLAAASGGRLLAEVRRCVAGWAGDYVEHLHALGVLAAFKRSSSLEGGSSSNHSGSDGGGEQQQQQQQQQRQKRRLTERQAPAAPSQAARAASGPGKAAAASAAAPGKAGPLHKENQLSAAPLQQPQPQLQHSVRGVLTAAGPQLPPRSSKTHAAEQTVGRKRWRSQPGGTALLPVSALQASQPLCLASTVPQQQQPAVEDAGGLLAAVAGGGGVVMRRLVRTARSAAQQALQGCRAQ